MGKPKTRDRRVLGSRPYKNYSEEMLQLAVQTVKKKEMSSRLAEKTFGIPRRTILNKIKELHNKKVGCPTRLSIEEEKSIVRVLIASGDYGAPLTKLDLRLMIFEYLKKNNREDVFDGKLPGKDWVSSFLQRHSDQLTVRSTQNIKTARAQKSLNDFLEYFQNLEETIKDVPPSNILNLDETNLSDDPGSSKCIFRRGVKYPERVLNSTKGAISVMFSGTADGVILPTYVVYKAENLYSEWMTGGPRGTRYNRTLSGWFDSNVFEDYFKTIILNWAESLQGRKIVICDNLSSHLNINIIELCEAHNISFIFIPPNSTHLTQPLDVAFFAPLKKAWRKILLQYKIENPQQTSLNKAHFPKLLDLLAKETKVSEAKNIKNGFRATGIYPFCPREVLKRIPEYAEEIGTVQNIDTTLLEYLKTNRQPKQMTIKRNKKVLVEPGKSVTVEDFQNKTDNVQKLSASKKSASKKSKKSASKKSAAVENPFCLTSQITTSDVNDKFNDLTAIREQTDMTILQENVEIQPASPKRDILDEKSGFFLSQITPAICDKNDQKLDEPHDSIVFSGGGIVRKCARTRIILKPSNYDLSENKSKSLKCDTQKPKIISTIIIPPHTSVQSNSNKENVDLLDADTLIQLPKIDLNEKLSDSRIISTMPKKVTKKESISSNKAVKQRPKKKDGKESKQKNIKKRYKIKKIIETSESDMEMSVHSDSDICNIEFDPDIPSYFHSDNSEFLSWESKNEASLTSMQTNPDLNRSAVLLAVNQDIEVAGPSTLRSEENPVECKINDHVLVRYFFKNKVEYYVGMVLEMPKNGKVKISFFRKVGKNDNTKFIKTKSPDIDLIELKNIVKTVDLLTINEDETNFVLNDDDDYMYFD